MSSSGCDPIPTDRPSSIQYADPSPRVLYASEIAIRRPNAKIAAARDRAIRSACARRPVRGPSFEPWARRGSLATLAGVSTESLVDGMCSTELMRLLRRSLIAVLLAAVLACPPAQAANPLAGKQVFIDCQAGTEVTAPNFNSWYWFWHYQGHDADKPNLIGKIAKVPVAKWFAGN